METCAVKNMNGKQTGPSDKIQAQIQHQPVRQLPAHSQEIRAHVPSPATEEGKEDTPDVQ